MQSVILAPHRLIIICDREGRSYLLLVHILGYTFPQSFKLYQSTRVSNPPSLNPISQHYPSPILQSSISFFLFSIFHLLFIVDNFALWHNTFVLIICPIGWPRSLVLLSPIYLCTPTAAVELLSAVNIFPFCLPVGTKTSAILSIPPSISRCLRPPPPPSCSPRLSLSLC